MSSALPTEDASTKTVNDFGLGSYDSLTNDGMSGENDETSVSPSLPGIPDMFEYEPYIGYPQMETPQAKHATFSELLRRNPHLAVAILPNDSNIPAKGSTRIDNTIDSLVLSPTDITSNSELPSEKDNPSARSDYYDTMQLGAAMSDMFADGDSGAYVSNEESLPTLEDNDTHIDNLLSALGNSDSGYIIEDQAVPYGHPSPDFQNDNITHQQSNNDLTLRAASMNRTATDIEFVKELTSQFIKAHGKKEITRRCVTAFLQEIGHGDRQYIASDIVRCLKHEHNVIIPDVLDIFPVRSAGEGTVKLSSIRDFFLDNEVYYLDKDIKTSRIFGRCASNIAEVINLFRQHEGGPGITG